jgi:DNA mismatch endonuclease, patch repair protein
MRDRPQSEDFGRVITSVDTFSKTERSEIMRRVRSKDTTPEMAVRSLLHRLGFRFRLHCKNLPGKPDIVLPKHKAVIFIHGCFWHRHPGCSRASTPATRKGYWLPKFGRTVERDKRNQDELHRAGWNVIVVWECELRDMDRLSMVLPNRITTFSAINPDENSTKLAAAEEVTEYISHPRKRD